ncbi:hypothetical protein QN372_19645 [Undibacterium sp. RTI2.1]|uniref:hypothetical protein n=1 Tax=unclassified Undibacterium TaxID=2630295 RepID=UPI002B230031|nr:MULTISPECIES: hypothetical protein [unclassified Undibacterium]MEB0032966.1 hypothetical protein [Undibacterium sp. RTI2.1]MEB0118725.1 hypothetical protein [Undibacterium sp. RTI2.2]
MAFSTLSIDTLKLWFFAPISRARCQAYAIVVLVISLIFPIPVLAQSKFPFPVYLTVEKEDATKRASLIAEIQSKIVVQNSSNSLVDIRDGIVIAVGYDSLAKLLDAKVTIPILAIAVSTASYKELVQNAPNVTVIYSDPSPESQFKFIQLLSGRRENRVAFIYSPRTEFLRAIVQSDAVSTNTLLQLEKVNNEEEVYKAIGSVTARWVLAYPDKIIYNQTTVRNVLLGLYQNSQLIVGFSKNLVSAGAVGSVLPTEEGYARQALEMIANFAVSKKLPSPTFPKYTKIVINGPVAKSLNYVISDELEKIADVIR